jgi:hypothetical protein
MSSPEPTEVKEHKLFSPAKQGTVWQKLQPERNRDTGESGKEPHSLPGIEIGYPSLISKSEVELLTTTTLEENWHFNI